MNLFTLSASLDLDSTDYERKAKEAENTGRSLANKMTVWSQAIAHATGDLLSRGVQGAFNFVKGMTKQAINIQKELEQNLGGAQAVFGDYYYFIRREGEKAYKELGLSQSDYLAEANKMGSLLQGMGYSQEESAETTIKVMQRAADVASIMGIDVADAMRAVEGAAKGNFTMMDNLGVAMNDTALNAYALQKGIGKTTQQMTTAEKIGLAFEYFMEKTAQYAGNYAKENDTLAGSMTTLNAAWENFLSGAGDADAVIDSAEGALGSIWKVAQELAPRFWNGAKRMFARVWPNVTTWIGQQVKNLPQTIGNFVTTGANGVIDLINGVFGTNIPHIDKIKIPSWDEMRTTAENTLNDIISGINDYFGTNIPKIGSPEFPKWEDLQSAVTTWWSGENGIQKKIEGAAKWVLSVFNAPDPNTSGKIVGDKVAEWWGQVRSFAEGALDWLMGVPEIEDADGTKSVDKINRWWQDRVVPYLNLVADFTLGMLGFSSFEELNAHMTKWFNETFKPLLDFLGIGEKREFNYAGLTNIRADRAGYDFVIANNQNGVKQYQGLIDIVSQIDALLDHGTKKDFEEFTQSMIDLANTPEGQGVFSKETLDALKVIQDTGEFTPNEIEALATTIQNQLVQSLVGVGNQEQTAIDKANSLSDALYKLPRTVNVKVNLIPGDRIAGYSGGFNTVGQFNIKGFNAKGLDYVPNNDYLTLLHRGEAILNAQEAQRWRDQGGRGQEYGGASAIVDAIQGLRNDFDNLRLYVGEQEFGRAVVDYGGSRVNSYIGGANRKIRRGYGRT